MSKFNILKNADVRNSMLCRNDTNIGYGVEWKEDNNFGQYGEFSGLTTRAVQNQTYFAVSTSGSCYISPTSDQAFFDGGVYDTIRAVFRLDVDFGKQLPTKGKIQFRTVSDPTYSETNGVEFSINPDNAYNEYLIDMSSVTAWQGEISRIRLFPMIDGDLGIKVHMQSLQVSSSSTYLCATKYGEGLCDKFYLYSHPCPWTGAGGSCASAAISDGLTIAEGVNDELRVNINGYGEQLVTLRPVAGADLKNIAQEIEDKLSSISIGGYSGNKTSMVSNSLTIRADDTREGVSTVAVIDTPAARTLGFYGPEGGNTSICTPGSDAASKFEPAGTIRISKSDIAQFYITDQNIAKSTVVVDPSNYAAEAGRVDYSTVIREQYIDFSAQTIINFNRPVTQGAEFVFFGYSGDATVNTEIVLLRPQATGALTVIATVPLGETDDLVGKVFQIDLSFRAREGDFIGIYDGKVYTGGAAEHPNVSYFLHNGQVTVGDVIEKPQMYGQGTEGLFTYCRGKDKQTEVVLDITFERPELIEDIEVISFEESRVERINITQTKAGGANGGPIITGTVGVDKFGATAPALADLSAITDGVKVNSPNAKKLHPSWLDSAFTPTDLYDQTEITIVLDFAKGIPVFFDIDTVVAYYSDTNNVKHFKVSYPLTTNEDDTDINWGSVGSVFNSVSLDSVKLAPTSHPLYTHPAHITVTNYVHAYQYMVYNSIALSFDSVRARSIMFEIKNDFFNEDLDSFDLSNFPLAPKPNFLELEVFASSYPKPNIADNFYFETETEAGQLLKHTTVRDTGSASVSHLIGYPVRKIRAHIIPQSRLEVKSFNFNLASSPINIHTNAGGQTVALQQSQNDFTGYEVATVTNTSDQTYNYYIDISPQRSAVERCILWNKLGTEEQLNTSQLGPSPSISKRESFFPRESNVALYAAGYVADPFWMQNRNVKTYISYDNAVTWAPQGNMLGDYSYSTELTAKSALHNEQTFVYILIDLGDVYQPDTVEIVRRTEAGKVVDFGSGISYSSIDVDTPEEVDAVNGFSPTKGTCRWLRLRSFTHDPDSFEDVPTVNFVRISLDPTHSVNSGKILWRPEPRLTNYNFGAVADESPCGEGWQCPSLNFNRYYAIDLDSYFNITNVMTGPNHSDLFAYTKDIDILLPGGKASEYTSNSKLNSNIGYGYTQNSDPATVKWGGFGAAPLQTTRWILIRRVGGILDEVVVHAKSGVPEDDTLFVSSRTWSSLLGTVTKDYSNYPTKGHSISITYAAFSGPETEEIELQQSLGIDSLLAKKDQLKVMFYVSDVSQLDLTQGHIAIGKNVTEKNGSFDVLGGVAPDRDNYFQWNISDMPGLISNGWNTLHLPFTDNFRKGQPYFTRPNLSNVTLADPAARSRLRWFRINFAGVENNKEFSIKVADLEMVRGDFLPAKFNNGIYLAEDEYARFPLNNFNTTQGTIEFFLNPDWTKTPGCNSCDDPRDHTIVRAYNSDDFMLGLFMTGDGLKLYFTNGTNSFFLTDGDSPHYVFSDVNTHIAITWDLLGEKSKRGMALYVNGKLSSLISSDVTETADWKSNPRANFILGGKAWDGLVAPHVGAVNGVVDNLKVYSYAKSDFSQGIHSENLDHVRTSDELVEISTDAVSFFSAADRGSEMPLLVRNVLPGQSFDVYIRNRNHNSTLAVNGQERMSYLEIVKARPG